MPILVVGIAGPPCAGKSEVAKVAVERGYSYIRMGDVVLEEVRKRGLEISEETVGKVAVELRKIDEAEIAKRCVKMIEKMDGKVLVDGVRGIAEVEEFKRNFGEKFKLIFVWSRRLTRFKRAVSRSREDDAESWEAFVEKDKREMSWGLGNVLMLSDYLLVNEGTLEELKIRAKEIFEGLENEISG